jgi:hypothetical protein
MAGFYSEWLHAEIADRRRRGLTIGPDSYCLAPDAVDAKLLQIAEKAAREQAEQCDRELYEAAERYRREAPKKWVRAQLHRAAVDRAAREAADLRRRHLHLRLRLRNALGGTHESTFKELVAR